MWISTLWDHDLRWVQWAVVLVTTWLAAMTDLKDRRIPNWLTVPTFFAGLIWATWIGGWAGLADAWAGCLITAVPFVVLFLFAGGGAGDAKMMGALGAWLGVIGGSVLLACVTLSGGVLAIGFALATRRLRGAMANVAYIAHAWTGLAQGRVSVSDATAAPRIIGCQTMPYGVAIFVGAVVATIALYVRGS